MAAPAKQPTEARAGLPELVAARAASRRAHIHSETLGRASGTRRSPMKRPSTTGDRGR